MQLGDQTKASVHIIAPGSAPESISLIVNIRKGLKSAKKTSILMDYLSILSIILQIFYLSVSFFCGFTNFLILFCNNFHNFIVCNYFFSVLWLWLYFRSAPPFVTNVICPWLMLTALSIFLFLLVIIFCVVLRSLTQLLAIIQIVRSNESKAVILPFRHRIQHLAFCKNCLGIVLVF